VVNRRLLEQTEYRASSWADMNVRKTTRSLKKSKRNWKSDRNISRLCSMDRQTRFAASGVKLQEDAPGSDYVVRKCYKTLLCRRFCKEGLVFVWDSYTEQLLNGWCVVVTRFLYIAKLMFAIVKKCYCGALLISQYLCVQEKPWLYFPSFMAFSKPL